MKPEEVRRRIEECKQKRLTKLDLSNWNTYVSNEEKMTAIPIEIFNFTWLKELYLTNNRLSEIPDSISRLQNLSTLFLSENRLSETPDSISHLQNLSRLYLGSNQLSELPNSISRLPNLWHWFSLIIRMKSLQDKDLTENTKLKKLFPS
jgi:surface protein